MSHTQDIYPIYYNDFGFAFQWKRHATKNVNKIQIVFRNTGLLLCKKELEVFFNNIKYTIHSNSECLRCEENDSCKSLLLDTPAHQVTLAMNKKELQAVHDLVEGTLFQLNLDNFIGNICSS